MKGNAPVMDQPGPKPCVLLADRDTTPTSSLPTSRPEASPLSSLQSETARSNPSLTDICGLRNLVERCFSKLKHSRRLATRYDKTADSFLGSSSLHPSPLDQTLCHTA